MLVGGVSMAWRTSGEYGQAATVFEAGGSVDTPSAQPVADTYTQDEESANIGTRIDVPAVAREVREILSSGDEISVDPVFE